LIGEVAARLQGLIEPLAELKNGRPDSLVGLGYLRQIELRLFGDRQEQRERLERAGLVFHARRVSLAGAPNPLSSPTHYVPTAALGADEWSHSVRLCILHAIIAVCRFLVGFLEVESAA